MFSNRFNGKCYILCVAGLLVIISIVAFAVNSHRSPECGGPDSSVPAETDSPTCCCSSSQLPRRDAGQDAVCLSDRGNHSTSDDMTAKGLYMGQKPPGLLPELFAPGIISRDDRYEIGITFSPDGHECYFVERTANWSASWIMMTHMQDGRWTEPQKASFSNQRSLSPSLSPDGQKLFFSSNRGTDGKQGIWQCTRRAQGDWSEPTEMMRRISSTADEWSCHQSDLGNMFVCSWRDGGRGKCDEWRIPLVDGQFQSAENLHILNTDSNDCSVVPGPKEAYMIFQSDRDGGLGKVDLYISIALGEGGWSTPRNLGADINSPQGDAAPWISCDGKYLFFSSTRRKGTSDIYWVQTQAFLKDITNFKSISFNDNAFAINNGA